VKSVGTMFYRLVTKAEMLSHYGSCIVCFAKMIQCLTICLYRLNTRFEFAELQIESSDDNTTYKSPSYLENTSETDPSNSVDIGIEPTADLRSRHSSKPFRKFSSEPLLVNRRSRCGFRERLRSDCVEEEEEQDSTVFSHNTSENCLHHVRTKRKSCHKHDRCRVRQTRLKSRPKLRRPLSECDARLNSSSLMNQAIEETTASSLTEDEMRSICIEVFLAR